MTHRPNILPSVSLSPNVTLPLSPIGDSVLARANCSVRGQSVLSPSLVSPCPLNSIVVTLSTPGRQSNSVMEWPGQSGD